MKYDKAFFLFLFLLFISCKNSTEPIIHDIVTTKNDLSNFKTILADHDSVVFKNNDDLLLKKKDIKSILIGKNIDGIFTEINYSGAPEKIKSPGKHISRNRTNALTGNTSTEPIYTMIDDKYRMEFEIPIKVDYKIYIENFIVRFILTDDTFIDIESPVNFYQFPFDNSQIYFEYKLGQNGDLADIIQDFDIVGNILYYHPYASFGLFKYDMITNQNQELFGYEGGDHIATAVNFIFIDRGHWIIKRYNISTSMIDIDFNLQQVEYCHDQDSNLYCTNLIIYGLAANNGIVYTLLFDSSDENIYLAQFDYDGNYLGSVPWETKYPYNLEFEDNILYSYQYNYGDNWLLRFDLNTLSFLESKPLPSPSPDGISITNGRFYYADYYRRAIFSIPMSDLLDE